MRVNAHLTFDGQCEAAFRMYEECLGGEITMLLKYGSSPLAADTPELEDKVVHATLKIGDGTLTGADVSSSDYEKPQGFAVQLNLDSPSDAQHIFDTLREGGTVRIPLQKVFWAEHYAILTDRFGIPWEVNCA